MVLWVNPALAQCSSGSIEGCIVDVINGAKMQSVVQLWYRAADGDPWQAYWAMPEWQPNGDFRYDNVALSQQYRVTASGPHAAYPRLDPLDYRAR